MRLLTTWRAENGTRLASTVWRAGPGMRMISSAMLGGGIGPGNWVLNAQVPADYARLDPVEHLRELAAAAGLRGPGVGMLTAAAVDRTARGSDGGVQAAATVGLRVPTWAAAPPDAADAELAPAGTVRPAPDAAPLGSGGDVGGRAGGGAGVGVGVASVGGRGAGAGGPEPSSTAAPALRARQSPTPHAAGTGYGAVRPGRGERTEHTPSGRPGASREGLTHPSPGASRLSLPSSSGPQAEPSQKASPQPPARSRGQLSKGALAQSSLEGPARSAEEVLGQPSLGALARSSQAGPAQPGPGASQDASAQRRPDAGEGDGLGETVARMEPERGADGAMQPRWRPGTVNIVVEVPAALSDAALVNAVVTATEAKTQALLEAGYACTGTASDAVCIAAPTPGGEREEEPFAGPRSLWGARIARAVHAAVYAGALDYTRWLKEQNGGAC